MPEWEVDPCEESQGTKKRLGVKDEYGAESVTLGPFQRKSPHTHFRGRCTSELQPVRRQGACGFASEKSRHKAHLQTRRVEIDSRIIFTPQPPPMPPKESEEVEDPSQSSSFNRQTQKVRDFFSIPAPLKKLFDQVPVVTYAPNHLPQRAPKPSRIPSLYVFAHAGDAAAGRPSFNPSCLKWQVSMPSGGLLAALTVC